MILKSETLALRDDSDVVIARQRTRALAIEQGFNLVDQTKVVTAASELARNTVEYGGGGELIIELLEDGTRRGIQLTFVDRGPGIEDVELAMTDGYTTGGGLGLGLSGSRRLMNEFHIESTPGVGTTVVVAKWR